VTNAVQTSPRVLDEFLITHFCSAQSDLEEEFAPQHLPNPVSINTAVSMGTV